MLTSSFYSFPWPHYFSEVTTNDFTETSFSQEIQKINKRVKQIEFAGSSPFLLLDQFIDLFTEKNPKLNELLKGRYKTLPEKYAKSQSAKVSSDRLAGLVHIISFLHHLKPLL